MKEFVEKLIERLKEYEYSHLTEHNSEECLHCEENEDEWCNCRNCFICVMDSAKKIINELAEEYIPCTKSCTDCEAYDLVKHNCPKFCKVIKETVEEVKENYNNGWIACSERLPDKYCHCLVTRRNDYEDGGFDTDVREDVYIELEGVWGWQSQYEGLIDNIIAWQPLPTPYKPTNKNLER